MYVLLVESTSMQLLFHIAAFGIYRVTIPFDVIQFGARPVQITY